MRFPVPSFHMETGTEEVSAEWVARRAAFGKCMVDGDGANADGEGARCFRELDCTWRRPIH